MFDVFIKYLLLINVKHFNVKMLQKNRRREGKSWEGDLGERANPG